VKTPTLAMLGPIEIAQFKEFLNPTLLPKKIPVGLGGSPVNLLCRELLGRGWKLLIITLSPEVQDEVILEGQNLKICIGPYRPKRARDFFSIEREYMLNVIHREKPNALHAQWTYEFALAAQASGLPLVITAHDAPIKILSLNFIPYRIARTYMAYRVLSRAKRVVSVSPYIAKHLKRFMLYRGTDKVIPNGMARDFFKSDDLNKIRQKPFTITCILNGWSVRKNGMAAIEAFAILRKAMPDAKLLMFGAGCGVNEDAEQYAKARNFEQGIEFAGHLPYEIVMKRLYEESDILLHPAIEESFGMIFIEAMAHGVPVIGGVNSGAVPWVLDYGKAGLLVDVTKPTEIAESILKLANNKNEMQALAKRGRAYAEKNFHIKVVADAYEKIYHQLLSENNDQ
jgi:glycosyltransferase involved in cell wall biosynthesis